MATLTSTNRSEIENNEIIRYVNRYDYKRKYLLGSGSYVVFIE
jgi:hypothetical protein